MLDRLFPDQRKFSARLSYLARHLTTAASLLEQALDHPEQLPELSAVIRRIEHQTDDAAQDLDHSIDRMFIPPWTWRTSTCCVPASVGQWISWAALPVGR